MKLLEAIPTGILTARRTDTGPAVVVKMPSRHCRAIPLVGEDRQLEVVVSMRDVMLPLYPNYGDYIHESAHSRDFSEMEEGTS